MNRTPTTTDYLLTALVATAAAVAGLIAAVVTVVAMVVPPDHFLAVAAGLVADPAMDLFEPWAMTILEDVAAGVAVWTTVFAVLFAPVCLALVARESRRLARQPGGYDEF